MTTVVLPFPDSRPLASAVADGLRARVGRLDWRHFPDGESLIAVDEAVEDADVVLFASLDDPDRKALPLRFAAQAARDLGARRVGLVAPYLAYMRQDRRFHAGEAISARVFARFLDECVDWLVTVDPHLHRIAALGDVFRIPATAVSAAPLLAQWVRREVTRPLVIGPDEESLQWVASLAHAVQAPHQVLRKVRHGDHEVETSLPDMRFVQGHTPVLVDDIVSTGRTLVAALDSLRGLGLPPPVCIVTHAIFAGDAQAALLEAGAGRIVSTDSIAHATNAISLAAPIARAAAGHIDHANTQVQP